MDTSGVKIHLYVSLFIVFCLIPQPMVCHRQKGRKEKVSSARDEDWTRWLEYIRKTSDVEDAASSVLGTSLSNNVTNSTAGNTSTTSSWRKIVVAQNGSGQFRTIQEAVNSVPNFSTVRTVICIQAGVYREKVVISKKKSYIAFLGEEGRTIVVWNDTAGTIGSKKRPLRTFRSATVAINSRHFIAKYIIFKNDAPAPVPGQMGGQAVALRVSGDNAAFYNCRFHGFQDTLYDHKGRHFFKNCFIEGSIDFIFGNGRSLYKNCELYVSSLGSVGSVTAQKRNDSALDTGFSFVECNLTGDGDVYLGRAWGSDSRVVFARTWMDNIIVAGGWNNWGVPSRDSTVFYGEFECSGPGANIKELVPWARVLTIQEAKPFLGIGYINGKSWLEQM